MNAGGASAREALGIEEAARSVGIGRTSMYVLLREGEGPPTLTLGRRRVIRVEALRLWLLEREQRERQR